MPTRRSHPKRSEIAAVGLACAALLASLLGCRAEAPPAAAGPKLALLIVVDQFRADYLDRFGPLFTGGLRRLIDQGVVFTEAYHGHAATQTATGHASLATGCHPRRHGIIANYWVDPAEKRRVYSVESERHGVSPDRLLVPTIGDWLKERGRRSRVFAVSGKDRSAVMLGGHQADGAFWYDEGEWVSSSYYGRREPPWLELFRDENPLAERFGEAWEPRSLPPELLAAAGVEAPELGPLRPGFPHVFGGLSVMVDENFYDQLFYSPWLDESMTRFAERLIVEEELGLDDWPDLLALGYSALDAVGHRFGPDSPEVLDVLLELDARLGELFTFVERRLGAESLLVALSSDHGVAPVPGRDGGRRLSAEDMLCFQRANRRLAEEFGEEPWLLRGPFVNSEAIARRGTDRAAVEAAAARLLATCPAVVRVWTRSELVAPDGAAGGPFFNGFYPARSPDLQPQFEPYFTPTLSSAATHGSAYAYDTHVPLVFLVPGLGPRRDVEPAVTVDLAPTLAALVGLEPPADLDGADLASRLAAAP